MIKVLLADDHTILREGLKELLSRDPEIEIVGEAANGQQAVKLTQELRPDLVVMDIAMPELSGIEATKKIRAQVPEVQVLILTQYDSEEYFFKVLQSGAAGYLLKETAGTELVFAIKTVARKLPYLAPAMTQILMREVLSGEEGKNKSSKVLSGREQEVLKLLAEGYSNQEIADKLFISVNTLQTHRSKIMHKLELNNKTELIKYAIRKGIISPKEGGLE